MSELQGAEGVDAPPPFAVERLPDEQEDVEAEAVVAGAAALAVADEIALLAVGAFALVAFALVHVACFGLVPESEPEPELEFVTALQLAREPVSAPVAGCVRQPAGFVVSVLVADVECAGRSSEFEPAGPAEFVAGLVELAAHAANFAVAVAVVAPAIEFAGHAPVAHALPDVFVELVEALDVSAAVALQVAWPPADVIAVGAAVAVAVAVAAP